MSRRSALALAVLVAAVMVVTVWGRALHEAGHYATLGDAAASEGRADDAIFHYRHAAQWYSPGGRDAQRSVDQLIALGDAARAEGQRERALVAWRSARIALISTRSLLVPNDGRLPSLHERIASAMAEQRLERAPDDAGAESRYLAQLNAWPERQPNRWLGLFASVCFLSWLLSLAGLAWFALDEQGRPQPRAAMLWGASVLLSFVGWMVGLRWA